MNVYVDAGGWVAYFDQSDRFYPLVTSYMYATLLQALDHLVTSDYVHDETVSYLQYHVSHATALTALRTLSALAQAQRMTMWATCGNAACCIWSGIRVSTSMQLRDWVIFLNLKWCSLMASPSRLVKRSPMI